MGISINLIDISANDGWQVASDKINQNFRNLYRSLSQNTSNDIRSSESSITANVSGLSYRITAVERTTSSLSTSLGQVQSNVSNLTTKVNANTSSISSINSEITSIKADIAKLKADVSDIEIPDLDELNQRIDDLEERLNELDIPTSDSITDKIYPVGIIIEYQSISTEEQPDEPEPEEPGDLETQATEGSEDVPIEADTPATIFGGEWEQLDETRWKRVA